MTLSRACTHLTSHTSAHESMTHATGAARFAFPANHIEIDNRLAWFTGRLDRVWGDRAAYVHLTRDPEQVARSFTLRANQGIIRGYKQDILARSRNLGWKTPLIDYCRDYVDTVTANITHYLRDKQHVMEMTLETMPDDFEQLCGWIGADGNLDAARAELAVVHNATEQLS